MTANAGQNVRRMPQLRFKQGGRAGVLAGSTTFDIETGTFTYTLSTDKPCKAYRGRELANGEVEPYEVWEVLKSDGCVNMDEIAGKPVCDTHDTSSVYKILGAHTGARVVGGAFVVTAVLSERAAVKELWGDVAEGIINSASIQWETEDETPPVPDPNGGLPTVTVTKWRMIEGSLVATPANTDAKIRQRGAPPMANENPAATPPATDASAVAIATAFASALKPLMDEQSKTRSLLEKLIKGGTRKRKGREEGDAGTDPATDEPSAGDDGDGARSDDDEPANEDSDKDGETDEERKKRKAKRAAKIAALRAVFAGNGRSKDFDNLFASGVSVRQLQQASIGAIATATPEIRAMAASQLPGGQRKIVSFEESSLIQKMRARAAR